MLTAKQNFVETLKKGGSPDRLVKQYEYGAFMPGDPIEFLIRGAYGPGTELFFDAFGVELSWPEGAPGVMPHVTEENKVIKDITKWRDYVKFPEVSKKCSGEAVWAPFMERVAAENLNEQFMMPFMHTGVFERLHFLMGFEDLFISLYEEPEAFKELCDAVGDYRLEVFKTLTENAKPELILSHDDWGSKTSLFMKPEMWREFIKPQYEKIYNYTHEHGIIVVHHADSFLEPLLEDMIDLHIDVWQGVLPTNNIEEIIKKADGRITLQGGLDSAIFDGIYSTEEEIRAHVREVCMKYGKMGHFIPSITYGGPGTFHPANYEIINDEIDKCSKEIFG